LEQNHTENHVKIEKHSIKKIDLKGVGRGHGRVAGLRGSSHKVDLHQRGGAQVATTGGQVHRGQTHRSNAHGIRAKPLTNTTAGEIKINKNQTHLVERKSSLS
jgi:hypothetical protein